MSSIGYATLSIIPSFKGGSAALLGDLNPALAGAGSAGGEQLGQGVMGKFKSLVGPLAAVAGAAAMGSFVKGSIAAAGNLEQSIGAIDAVFKGSAGQMHAWAETAATDVGITKDEYNSLGSLIGSQLKNAGVSMDQLGPKTNDLIKTGADMAAQFGGSTAEAVEALSSAIKGERDPIEKYGVSLNQAAIDAKAAELGFTKVGGSLSQEANAAATVALVMQQTADAHGAFARETDTLAHKQQVLSAMWEDGKAKLGTVFLPVVAQATGLLINLLGPAIDATVAGLTWLFSAVGNLVGVWQDNGVGMAGFSGTLDYIVQQVQAFISGGGLANIFKGFAEARSAFFNAIIQALPGILEALVQFLPQVVQFLISDFIPGIVDSVVGLASQLVTVVTTILPQLVSAIATSAPALLEGAAQAFSSIVTALVAVAPTLLQAILAMVPQLITTLLGMIPTLLTTALTLFNALIQGLLEVVPSLLSTIIQMLPGIITSIISMLPSLIGSALTLFMGLVNGLVQAIPQLLTAILDALPTIITTLVGMLPALVEGAINLFLGLVLGLLQALPKLIVALINMLPKIVLALVGMMPTLVSTAIQLFVQLVVGVVKAIPQVIAALVGMIPQIVGALVNAVPKLIDAGWRIVEGFIKGIVDAAPKVMQAIGRAITGPLPQFVKDALGIHSPSRVFRGFGQNVSEGMALGILDGADQIVKAADSLLPALPGGGSYEVAAAIGDRGVLGGADGRGGDTYNIYEAVSPEATAQEVARRQNARTV